MSTLRNNLCSLIIDKNLDITNHPKVTLSNLTELVSQPHIKKQKKYFKTKTEQFKNDLIKSEVNNYNSKFDIAHLTQIEQE